MTLRQLGALLAIALTLPCANAADPKPITQPNIVLIVADDLGFNSVGYHAKWVQTPNIDRLAQQGVSLERFYVSPMCSPTREGLMTGRYPMRFGMARSVIRPWMHAGLPPEEDTLPELLGQAGYRHRGAFGKWHLGHLGPQWHPLAQGFTEFEGMYNGAANYWNRDRDGEPDWHVNYTPTQKQGYTTDLIADAAAAFIRKHAKDGPFFCYVPFSAPHEPFQAPDAYLAKYAALDDNPSDGKPSERQTLAAMINCMDDGIGKVLQALRDSNATSNTLIWFMSDNGGTMRVPGQNTPLREGKLTTYEGGVRVPAAVWLPGAIEGGRKISEPIANIDVLPTLLHAADAKTTSAKPLDGVDVWEVLAGKAASLKPRDLYFFDGQSGIEKEQIAIIAADGWKLVISGPDIRRPEGYRTQQHRVELFNLAVDPVEANDLSTSQPERTAELGKKLIAFRASEPPSSLATQNKPPAGFKPPHQWAINSPADRKQ